MTNEDFREKVISHIVDGGWSGISDLIDSIDIDWLRGEYDYLDDDED